MSLLDLLPTGKGTVTVRVSVEGAPPLDVRHYDVAERAGHPFEIELEVVTTATDLVDLEAWITAPARFELLGPGPIGAPRARVWTGVVVEAARGRRETRGVSTYRLSIRPELSLLRHRRSSRVFQVMSDVDVLEKVLGEWAIPTVVEVDRAAYKPRKYRVQFDEADLDYFQRLVEDLGILYLFRPDERGRTQLVLADRAHTAASREPPLVSVQELGGLVAPGDFVARLQEFHEVAPTAFTQRDSDHRRSATIPLEVTDKREATTLAERLEIYEFCGGGFNFIGDASTDSTPVADWRGKARTDLEAGKAIAERRLDARRAFAKRWTFSSNVVDLAPGQVITVLDEPGLEGKRLLVVAASLSGRVPGPCAVSVVVVEADGRYRLAPGTHRPRVDGTLPATVVGPPGEEIHTDEFGRVAVQFHWDREGELDQNSSCWVPVSSAWAGDGYGNLMLPRVGHEVLVEFLGGDPDRPMVTGRVYHHLHPAPRKLPDERSVTVVARSRTIGGEGYNEIAFDDAAGKELFSTHAARDADESVVREKRITVGERFVLQVGASSIEVTPDAVRIHSPFIEAIATGDHVIRGKRVLINCENDPAKPVPIDRKKADQEIKTARKPKPTRRKR